MKRPGVPCGNAPARVWAEKLTAAGVVHRTGEHGRFVRRNQSIGHSRRRRRLGLGEQRHGRFRQNDGPGEQSHCWLCKNSDYAGRNDGAGQQENQDWEGDAVLLHDIPFSFKDGQTKLTIYSVFSVPLLIVTVKQKTPLYAGFFNSNKFI